MGRARRYLAHAARNVFNDQPRPVDGFAAGTLPSAAVYGSAPDRVRFPVGTDKSIIMPIYMRMAIDFASIDIRHVRLDDQKRYVEDIESGLHNCLNVEANLDQAARHFMKDIAMTLFASGVIAIVPVDFKQNPQFGGSWDIQTMRVGTITAWSARHIRVRLYNDKTGRHEEIMVPKRHAAIIENPFYEVMNEPNSILQKLVRKLNLMDMSDEQIASGKLDMIIQLPYTIKTETKRDQANTRLKDIEFQLRTGKYGIAYADAAEKITQLNRPVENNLLKHAEMLLAQLYTHLGLTAEIMNGTADEAAMLNYYNRTIEPLLGAVSEAFARTFITKTARSQGQAIGYFRDPFKLVPMKDLAELADKFTRNEIVTSNEFRGFIGLRPAADPKADELRNSNLTRDQAGFAEDGTPLSPDGGAADLVNAAFDEVDEELKKTFQELGIPEEASA